MTVAAKICGMKTPDAVQAAVDGKASHIGFIFFPKSPRNIAPDAAARLTPPARAKNVKIVAVTVDPDDELLDRLASILAPDLIPRRGLADGRRRHQGAAHLHRPRSLGGQGL
jgi:phosphoribosylanthranilate isomerase